MQERLKSDAIYIKQSGFTLIELLVVVVIIGVSITFVGLSFSVQDNDSILEEQAQQFATQSKFVAEHTVLAAEVVGLFMQPEMSRDGSRWCYRWRRYRDQSWTAIGKFIEDNGFTASVEIDMIVEGEQYEHDERITTPVPVLEF